MRALITIDQPSDQASYTQWRFKSLNDGSQPFAKYTNRSVDIITTGKTTQLLGPFIWQRINHTKVSPLNQHSLSTNSNIYITLINYSHWLTINHSEPRFMNGLRQPMIYHDWYCFWCLYIHQIPVSLTHIIIQTTLNVNHFSPVLLSTVHKQNSPLIVYQ